MLGPVDRFLNGITMYRLVLYVLAALAGVAILLASFGLLSYSGIGMAASLAVLFLSTYVANWALAELFGAPSNPESSPVTALILFFVLSPATSYLDVALLAFSGGIAMLAKYIFSWRKQHLANPAAVAAVAVGIPTGLAIWWVGTPLMLPFVAIAGFLVARKVRRIQMVLVTIAAGALVTGLHGVYTGGLPGPVLYQFLFSWPIVFFAAFMVTEPVTAPGTHRGQLLYGAALGAVTSWPIGIGAVYLTPELSLVLANIVTFFTGLRRRLVLRLEAVREIARDTYEFAFARPAGVTFQPGQYLEWTARHATPDARGIRRYFTIASSPTEKQIKLGVKIGADRSSFKENLLALRPGDEVAAGVRSGSFVLPPGKKVKLGWIAGGIGITPFRSMAQYVTDARESRNVRLLYACRSYQDVAYADVFRKAGEAWNLRTTYILSEDENPPEGAERGFLDAAMLERVVPDFLERTWYLSGPNAMVEAYRKLLRSCGVADKHIRTDYFPGF